jgi:predicted aldo/keto reductase-like oxidoreductase
MDRREFLKSATLLAATGAVMSTGVPIALADENASSTQKKTIMNYKQGMQYRPMGKTGAMVSALGFGMMRPPVLPDGSVDEENFKKMVRHSIDNGLNYIDTSYVYSGGKSEEITGRILKDGYREKVYLATKHPWFVLKKSDDFERILDQQLENLQTDSIDFYPIHMVTPNGWKGPVTEFKLTEKMEHAKERGKIKHMGFSYHGSLPVFKEIVNYTPNWDFCQFQLNYLDTEYEAGLLGMKYASDRGMGVVVIEPLRGKFLADMPTGVNAILNRSKKKRSDVEWAFDFLWNMPEISLLLSGMSDMRHVIDNLLYASRSSVGMLNLEDRKILSDAVFHLYSDYGAVPCTGCEYCHAVCLHGVAVAQVIMPWNQYKWNGDLEASKRRFNGLSSIYGNNSTSCIGCGTCLPTCPQRIDIPGVMKMIRDDLKV